MPETLNRRTFIKTSAATAGMLPVIGTSAPVAVVPATNDTRSSIRVKKLYLAKPVPTWPTPHLDVAEERLKLENLLADLQKDMPDVSFEGGELLRVIDDVPKVRESLNTSARAPHGRISVSRSRRGGTRGPPVDRGRGEGRGAVTRRNRSVVPLLFGDEADHGGRVGAGDNDQLPRALLRRKAARLPLPGILPLE